jgi:hypothetical protein
MKLELKSANGAAWRARYLYVDGKQVAHVGIDPTERPTLFGRIASHSFRVALPRVPWKYPCSPAYLKAYQLSNNFWHNMDGRYGWGGSCRK